jgi:hypothetical protein
MQSSDMPSAKPPLRCALLLDFAWDYAFPIVDAAPNLELLTLDGPTMGLPRAPNPFGLPLADKADVVLVSAYFVRWLRWNHPDKIGAVFDRLERVATVIAGLDGVDEFALYFPPELMERFTLVLKTNGLYKDRDLYNYRVGTLAPGGRWTEKLEPLGERYSDYALSKLRLSMHLFMRVTVPALRQERRREAKTMLLASRRMTTRELIARYTSDSLVDATLSHMPLGLRTQQVHCVGQLSHIQRLETVQRLVDFSGAKGITSVPKNVAGIGFPVPEDRHAQLERQVEPYRFERLGRYRFQLSVARHKVGVAPTGYGEMTYRHGEVMRAGAALVCQSLEHVEMQFQFRDDENVVFCRPDLADLTERVRELLADDERRLRIAGAGRRYLLEWNARWHEHYFHGIEKPLRDALAGSSAHS